MTTDQTSTPTAIPLGLIAATRRAEESLSRIRGRADYAGIRLVAFGEAVHPSSEHQLSFDHRVRLFETGHL